MNTPDELALASPFSRREWSTALDTLGAMSEALLPAVHGLCALGWSPSRAAAKLVAIVTVPSGPR